MKIPMPTWGYLLWTIFFCLFLIGSRLVTVFPVLYFMRQGYRVSLLPAINLCQMSELSLVLLALGKASGDVSDNIIGIAAFSFALLAVDSTYAIFKNDFILQKATPWLNKIGFRDLDQGAPADDAGEKPKRICLLGFSWTASSLLEEISRERSDLLPEIVVVDFNPKVYEQLRQRGVRVVYGDITQRDMLHHAGVSHAEIIICSLPNMVLKGADNLKMLRQLRELNPRRENRRPRRIAFGHSRALRRRRQLRHRAAPARSRRPAPRHRSRRKKSARPETQGAGKRIERPG